MDRRLRLLTEQGQNICRREKLLVICGASLPGIEMSYGEKDLSYK